MIDTTLASGDLHGDGVSAHGYVDTRAHQNFVAPDQFGAIVAVPTPWGMRYANPHRYDARTAPIEARDLARKVRSHFVEESERRIVREGEEHKEVRGGDNMPQIADTK